VLEKFSSSHSLLVFGKIIIYLKYNITTKRIILTALKCNIPVEAYAGRAKNTISRCTVPFKHNSHNSRRRENIERR
jgi:hypothetical protein